MNDNNGCINPVELLKKIMRYRKGEGRYNFSRLDEDIDLKAMEAWEEIEHEIHVCINQHEQNSPTSQNKR